MKKRYDNFTSSNVVAYEYDEDNGELVMEFKGGIKYQFLHVPAGLIKRLHNAESKGSFFNVWIKPVYNGVKIS